MPGKSGGFTNNPDKAEKLRDQLQPMLTDRKEIDITEATPRTGVHVGSQAFVLVCVKASDST